MRRVWHWRNGELHDGPAPRPERFGTGPAVWGSFNEFVSPASGQVISDRGQHRRDLAAAGCHVKEKGEWEVFPVDPKSAGAPGYDADRAKEWYSRQIAARTPEPESPAVRVLINSDPRLRAIAEANDVGRRLVNPYD